MKRLVAWGTELKHRYQTSVFYSTWLNIVIFHVFFVLVMVIVFQFALDYTKVTIFSTLNDLLIGAIAGETPDPKVLASTVDEVDRVGLYVSTVIIVMSVGAGIAAAHITLGPTRRALLMQKHFISAVAHELRTPLAVIRTQNEVALYDVPSESPLREVIEGTITETKHMKNVLNNLLVFSRVDITETIAFSGVELDNTIAFVVSRLKDLAGKHKVELVTSIAAVAAVRGNQTAVEQALYNVIKNAIVYSGNRGRVTISLFGLDSNWACVTIEDEGVGIPADKLPHIFAPFFRVNEERIETRSMGLGLSLVYEIMKLHGGSVSVESEEGKGSRFTLTFPILPKTTNGK